MINSRVKVEYDDQNEAFAEFLPRTGRIVKQCKSKSGIENWFLVSLDEPFEYQSVRPDKSPVQTFQCNSFLIRSRWEGHEIRQEESVPVFIMLAFRESDSVSLIERSETTPPRLSNYEDLRFLRQEVTSSGPVHPARAAKGGPNSEF
jgi:hypothetical protein